MLELAVEREAPFVLIVGEQRRQHVNLVQGRSGTQWKALPTNVIKEDCLDTNLDLKKDVL
jgi:hypothetical protein